jgi:hypothetical protein
MTSRDSNLLTAYRSQISNLKSTIPYSFRFVFFMERLPPSPTYDLTLETYAYRGEIMALPPRYVISGKPARTPPGTGSTVRPARPHPPPAGDVPAGGIRQPDHFPIHLRGAVTGSLTIFWADRHILPVIEIAQFVQQLDCWTNWAPGGQTCEWRLYW